MTRPRKITLSMKEFSHLVSESLDVANSPSQSLVNKTSVVSDNCEKPKTSSFQRIFSRPPSTTGEEKHLEEVHEAPRKMGIGWPFSRSPRKIRSVCGEDSGTDVKGVSGALTIYQSNSANSAVSLAGASTSSFGSIMPAHERHFQDVDYLFSDEVGVNSHSFSAGSSSPITIAQPHGPLTSSGHYAPAPRSALHAIFRSKSAANVIASTNAGLVETIIDIFREGTLAEGSRGSTHTTQTLTASEAESSEDDPTPRATSFGARAIVPPPVFHSDSTLAQRRRPQGLSLVLPPQHCDILSLRPAVGVTPHVPSETDCSMSTSHASSPTSPFPHSSSLTSLSMRSSISVASQPPAPPSSPLRSPTSATPSEITPHSASVSSVGSFPWGRARAGSRSMKSPPLPRPPPTGPLPAVPTPSSIPPVPPLPPLLKKMSMKRSQQLPISSPTRPTLAGAAPPTSIAVATPPASPGSLRLPSRLSWLGTGRAVVAPSSSLPSPPASPTRSSKSPRTPPDSPSKGMKKQRGNLKRPTSIGVLEAADNAHVRRTKSILLLGSRSKSNASLRAPSTSPQKRVQIHADANADAGGPPRKPRRKSSAAAAGHPVGVSIGGGDTLSGSPEILVPRERRHSAPLLSRVPSSDATNAGACADWTLSLPFCTDTPGHKITPIASPALAQVQLEPEPGVDEYQGDDWTLCMPLKVGLGATSTSESVEEDEERGSECTLAQTSETCISQCQSQTQMQLPTPSPSPTPPTPLLCSRALDSEEPRPRPASPASLGPHAGGLDIDGGCGKRGSGWNVCGWFESVDVQEDEHVPAPLRARRGDELKATRRCHEAWARNRSQDSTVTISTAETGFYSARSSLRAG
ncbi:hypothetical protein BS17DRAFT_810149 [Gyrodon lividus]|nr:hypothetical protein BS17DRAFT_810149 [Gyrodon lividus]